MGAMATTLMRLYFPRKNGHEKRLDLLSQFGLLDK